MTVWTVVQQTVHAEDRGSVTVITGESLIGARDSGAFDLQAALLARLVDAPVGLVTVLDADRQHFVGHHTDRPLDRATPLRQSLCAVVADEEGPLVLPDVASDPALAAHPAATELGVGAYLGVPLHLPDGSIVGAVCAIDWAARSWHSEHRRIVEVTRDHIESRIAAGVGEPALPALLTPALRHELGGDIAVVVSGVETALVDGLPDDTRRLVLERTRDHAGRLMTTLDDLMRLSPLARSVVDTVTVAALLDDDGLGLGDPRVSVDLAGATGETVSTDVGLLRRMIGNLVRNALRHTDSDVEVRVARYDDTIAITVEDHGQGLPGHGRSVFEPFVRGTLQGEGLGLGLALVSRIADRIDADVDVATGSGGTVFTIRVARGVADAGT